MRGKWTWAIIVAVTACILAIGSAHIYRAKRHPDAALLPNTTESRQREVSYSEVAAKLPDAVIEYIHSAHFRVESTVDVLGIPTDAAMTKEIYILWLQGFENAPGVVQMCLRSWRFHNPDWNINIIDERNIGRLVRLSGYIGTGDNSIDNTKLSDIIRCILLFERGGVWVDATTFCNRPLVEWLPANIREGFFAFENGPLSSWFLYSDARNYVTRQWLQAILVYFQTHDRAHTYFVIHELFGKLYESDERFKRIWDRVPKLSANGLGPHYLQEKGFFKQLTYEVKRDIDGKITPLYKLTYKCDFGEMRDGQNLSYLYGTIQ